MTLLPPSVAIWEKIKVQIQVVILAKPRKIEAWPVKFEHSRRLRGN